jgi:hypothetical protein
MRVTCLFSGCWRTWWLQLPLCFKSLNRRKKSCEVLTTVKLSHRRLDFLLSPSSTCLHSFHTRWLSYACSGSLVGWRGGRELLKINVLDPEASPSLLSPCGNTQNFISPSLVLHCFLLSSDLRASLISSPPFTVSDVSGKDSECRISHTIRDKTPECLPGGCVHLLEA